MNHGKLLPPSRIVISSFDPMLAVKEGASEDIGVPAGPAQPDAMMVSHCVNVHTKGQVLG